jgi:DNA-binding GntR family transcriptional regulator
LSDPSTEGDFEAPLSHTHRHGRRQQLSEEAADYLRDAIIAAEIGSGEFVRPEHVANELGMSPTPVREALMALAKEGFLVWQPRRGFRVAKVRPSDIEDVFSVQAFIAGELAARAAGNIADANLAHLDELQTALGRAGASGDVERVQDLNFQIHKTINKLAGSPALARLLSIVVAYVPRRFYGSVPGWPAASVKDHGAILDALRSRHREAARAAMTSHIWHAGALLGEHISTHIRDGEAGLSEPTDAADGTSDGVSLHRLVASIDQLRTQP